MTFILTPLSVVSAEEGDDEDDPEYNFLDDLDEPDREDYRTDRAVRITSEFICDERLWRMVVVMVPPPVTSASCSPSSIT